MAVKQWIVNLNGGSITYPAEAQVRVPFEPESVAFVHLGVSRSATSPDPAGDVQIAFDAVLPVDQKNGSTDPDNLLLSAAAPGNAFGLNDRFNRIFLRMAGGATSACVQVIVTKGK
jgi:hypothetical protein